MDAAGLVIAGTFSVAFTAASLLLACERRRHRRALRRLASLQTNHDALKGQYGRLVGLSEATMQAGRDWRTAFFGLLSQIDPERAQQGMRLIAQSETAALLRTLEQAGRGET